MSYLDKIAPGLAKLRSYQSGDLQHDFRAGLSVASVALPVGVAYAQLAGFDPSVGLYSSILPLVAYAIFGSSRQLIIGPDAATCALVTAAVTPLAAGDHELYKSLSITLAFLAGVLCICGRFLRLGVIADFLSKPILVGFLNGVALSIILGQLGKLFGYSIASGGIIPRLIEFIQKLGATHFPTLAIGAISFFVLLITPRLMRRIPAALLAMFTAAIIVRVLGLEGQGVKIVGDVPAGLPALALPHFPLQLIPGLIGDAAGLALVTFSSMMLTARSFASKNRYDIDVDQEFAALGISNIASAFSQGFAVSGADSRTAMSDAAGGRTQVTGLIAAATIGIVLLFFTRPLRYVPEAALGAVLVMSAVSLVDVSSLRIIYRIDRGEFALSILASLGVVAVGPVQAILVAVVLAIVRFVRIVSRPKIEILGEAEGVPGFHCVERHSGAVTIPGLMLLRFNGPIVFFNAPFFKRGVITAADGAGESLKWLVLDLLPVSLVDATGLLTVEEVADSLRDRGVTLAAAGRETEWRLWAEARRREPKERKIFIYPTLDEVVKAYRHDVLIRTPTSCGMSS